VFDLLKSVVDLALLYQSADTELSLLRVSRCGRWYRCSGTGA